MAEPTGQEPPAHEPTDEPSVPDGEMVSESDQAADGLANQIETRRRRILEIAASYRRLPIVDPRSDDEILGYNEYGTFD